MEVPVKSLQISGWKEGSAVKDRCLCAISWGKMLAVVLLVGSGLLNPPAAQGQDRILPLEIKVGEKAPDFALPDAEGKMVKLSDHAGHKVLIDFYRGYW